MTACGAPGQSRADVDVAAALDLEHHRHHRHHRRSSFVVRRSSFVVRRRILLYGDIVVMILFYIIQLDSILPSLSREFGREDGMHASLVSSPPATNCSLLMTGMYYYI